MRVSDATRTLWRMNDIVTLEWRGVDWYQMQDRHGDPWSEASREGERLPFAPLPSDPVNAKDVRINEVNRYCIAVEDTAGGYYLVRPTDILSITLLYQASDQESWSEWDNRRRAARRR